ncbi:MAG TPA: hypothetical protein VFC92_05285 [Bacteroidales bacterium]|nr:hypothetical protein [Bacteroidales bacterium]
MKKFYLTLFAAAFLLIAPGLRAQNPIGTKQIIDGRLYIDGLPVFTEADLAPFADLPKLTLTLASRGRELPVMVDNSQRPWFRPIFDQVALECGQASAVSYTFTYEINRLRDLPANIPDNQYVSHFVYNWGGNGNGQASAYFDSWDIVKHVGTPNVPDYGGSLSYGGSARWMSGYDKYYNSMKNRLWDFYSIDVTTEDGLNTLKHWFDNHLEGEATGGIGNIYSAVPSANATLPPGTPEAGKHVILQMSTYANHAVAIVGYHDSIRYDLNNDGQYTNHLDINGDGVVDIRDWEIGGVKVANSYYASAWGDAGFAWCLYSALCRTLPQGGCWNGSVHVVKAKENTEPQLTYKVKLTHNVRNTLKVMAGVAVTPGATEPEYIIDFPILDYQGGTKYMTGGSNESDKTLEFGLDVTPLLDYVQTGQQARYFLLVNEKDPYNSGTGMINNFTLIDYTEGMMIQTPCSQTNVPLTENGLTTLFVSSSVTFTNPQVLNVDLPPATINEPYNNQMIGTQGTYPYQWKIKQKYSSQSGTQIFPIINDQQLYPNNQSTGYVTKTIDFDFPFYGKNYHDITLHTDGYIMFREDHYPWTFIVDQYNLFRNMRCISPLMCDPIGVAGGGMWYEGNSQKATFRWRTSEYGTSNMQDFAVSLYPDGKIEFYYGYLIIASWNRWYAGISEGDDFNYELLDISNTPVAANTKITLEPDYEFTEMSITEKGLFSGLPTQPYEASEIEFSLKDANGLRNSKMLYFSTEGANQVVIRDVLVQAGDNSIIENGETAILSVELKNISQEPALVTLMKIAIGDPYVTLIDSLQTLTTIQPGQTVMLEDAFSFSVATDVPNNHDLIFNTTIQDATDVYNSHIYLKAYAPALAIGNITFDDGNNGYPEPGEIIAVMVNIKNTGGGRATNVQAHLMNADPYVSITQPNSVIAFINGGATGVAAFEVSIAEDAPFGYNCMFSVTATADYGFTTESFFGMSIGLFIEDFETGDFSQYDWEFAGNAPWVIDNFDPYEGQWCMRSGEIDHSQNSEIFVTMDVLIAGKISFYYVVQSENNYDFLKFYVNGEMKAQWAGDTGWGFAEFDVPAGETTFRWVYVKDYSVSTGLDAGYIDYITFPPTGQETMAVSAGPDMSICEDHNPVIQGFIINATTIFWTTSGDGTFDDHAVTHPVYTPGTNDIDNGVAELMVTAWDNQNAHTSDEMILYISLLPNVFAGNDLQACDNRPAVEISGSVVNALVHVWISAGDGTFGNDNSLTTDYFPGLEDVQYGSVELMLMGKSLLPCTGSVEDALTITFIPAPVVTFDTLPLLGTNMPPYELFEGNPVGGIYEGPGVIDGWLHPDVAGVGLHTLRYTYTDDNGCTESAEQVVEIVLYVNIASAMHHEVTIRPNPGTGLFTIYGSGLLNDPFQLKLIDAAGYVVMDKPLAPLPAGEPLLLDATGFAPGMYYLQLIGSDGVVTRKLVISR